jgi:hypothetical protein
MRTEHWKCYTLSLPVTRCKHFSLDGIFQEMESCSRNFYSLPHILLRVCANLWQRRTPLISLIGNLSYRPELPAGLQGLRRLQASMARLFRRRTERQRNYTPHA